MGDFGCFNLKDAVTVAIHDGHGATWKAGIVTGRTLEQNPRYDVRFTDGTVELNIAASRIQPRESRPGLAAFHKTSGGRDSHQI